jgi:protein TonB
MDYAQQQRNPAKHLTGIAIVIVFHILLVWALVNGLARKVVDVVKGPLETKIIQEMKPPPPEAPPPPPPKFAAPPPPPFIPPPEINIAQPQQSAGPTITAVTNTKPPPAPPKAVARVAPQVKARGCREPEYPPVSARLGEAGRVVLALLVDTNGKVIDSRVQQSSGYPRLDEAARRALSLCKFQPGTADGKPVQAWGQIAYVFKNPDR